MTCFYPSLVHLLRDRSTTHPNQVLCTFLHQGQTPSVPLTYQSLDNQARAIATVLQKRIEPESRALLLYSPGLEFIAAFLGCLYAGVIAVPAPSPETIGKARNLQRLKTILVDAAPAIVLTTTHLQPQLADWWSQFTHAHLPIATETIPLSDASQWIEPILTREKIAYLQYTSGSTSAPKGVMITHGNLMANLAALAAISAFDSESTTASWVPHFHDLGLIRGCLLPIYQGIPNYLLSPLTFIKHPNRWLEVISHYRVTHIPGTNFFYDYCVTHVSEQQRQGLDLSCLKAALVGAEPVRFETLQRFTKAYEPYGFCWATFCPGYGLAEATLAVAVTSPSQQPVSCTVSIEALAQNQVQEMASGLTLVGCGKPIADTQVMIVHPQTLCPCEADEIGEIWVSSESIAQGYWNQPEMTKQTFQAALNDQSGQFLRTGDLGFLKNDCLFVTGRLKDLLIIRGQNYYPQDIEWTVANSHPALQLDGGAAFAIDVDGNEQLAIVFEVSRKGSQGDLSKIVAAIRNAVAHHHELPVYVVALLKQGSVPKTTSGKIQRHACRQGFLANTLECLLVWQLSVQSLAATQDRKSPRSEIEFRLQQIWQQVLEHQFLDDIGLQDNFFELGGDSLKAVSVLTKVEQLFGQEFPVSALLEAPTIEQFAQHIAQPDWASHSTALVPIRPKGNKLPFFYVHPRSGSVLLYANLTQYFDPHRPLYGLQSVGLDGQQTPHTRIEAMATHYLQKMRTVQPKGPYFIGGRCLGGAIALEMAQQLQKQGEEVLQLLLIESPRTPIVDPVLANQIQRNVDQIRRLSTDRATHFQQVMQANDEAGRQYHAKPYSGSAAYFAATETIHDPSNSFGWAELITGHLQIWTVPGTHLTIGQAPNLPVFAQQLCHCLDLAEQEYHHRVHPLPSFQSLSKIRADLDKSQRWLTQLKQQLEELS